jgi:hypothetical protein
MAKKKGKGTMDSTDGVKYDEGKPQFSLMKTDALLEMVAVLTYGAKKYSPDNWEKLENGRQRYFDAANRHMWQWFGGEERDQESGLHHLAHAMSSLMFLIQMDINLEKGNTEEYSYSGKGFYSSSSDWETTKIQKHSDPHGW